jgi:hypothetical protein
MATVVPFIREYAEAAFEPEATAAMSTAFDDVCRALNIPQDMTNERETIAIRIIDLARTGVIDAAALRDRVVEEARAAAA